MNPWLTLLINATISTMLREIYASLPRAAYWFIRRETVRLPVEIRERYLEEWLAESEAYVGSLKQLVYAISLPLFGAATSIARDYNCDLLDQIEAEVQSMV